MTELSRPPLEQGTALTQLWEAADDLRAAQAELSSRVQDHSMVVFAYVRDIADGGEPDPTELHLSPEAQREPVTRRDPEDGDHPRLPAGVDVETPGVLVETRVSRRYGPRVGGMGDAYEQDHACASSQRVLGRHTRR